MSRIRFRLVTCRGTVAMSMALAASPGSLSRDAGSTPVQSAVQTVSVLEYYLYKFSWFFPSAQVSCNRLSRLDLDNKNMSRLSGAQCERIGFNFVCVIDSSSARRLCVHLHAAPEPGFVVAAQSASTLLCL